MAFQSALREPPRGRPERPFPSKAMPKPKAPVQPKLKHIIPSLSSFVRVPYEVAHDAVQVVHGLTPGTTTPSMVHAIGASLGHAGTKSSVGAPHLEQRR